MLVRCTATLHGCLCLCTSTTNPALNPLVHAPVVPCAQTPEGAQRLAATISRNVSRLSLLGSAAGNSSSGSLAGAGGGAPAGEAAPLLPPPPSPFDQPRALPQQAVPEARAEQAAASEQQPKQRAQAQRQAGGGSAAAGAAGEADTAAAASGAGLASGYVSP